MESSILYTTESNNAYLYDNRYRLAMLVHPDLRKVHEKQSDFDSYYKDKYEYLKSHGFFSLTEPLYRVDLTPADVQDNLGRVQQIVFEATGACNLMCSYCIQGNLYDGFEAREYGSIDYHSAITLLEYVFEYKKKVAQNKITISFYGGEPLLNIGFIKDIVGFIKTSDLAKNFNVSYSMTTNATLLYKNIDFFHDNNFKILISLDGGKENNVYRKLRSNGLEAFEQIIDNVDCIKKEYPDYFKENIEFNSVLNDKNSVKDIYEFIYGKYGKIPRISELSSENLKSKEKDEFGVYYRSRRRSEEEFQSVGTHLKAITHNQMLSYWELAYFINYYLVNSYVINIPELFCEKALFPSNTCLPFYKKIFLTSGNKILPCERINHKYYLGYVNGNVEIDFLKIAKQYNMYYESMRNNCNKCYAFRFCGTCMFGLENLGVKKNKCKNFHSKQMFKNKLSRIFSYLEKYPQDFSDIVRNVVITS